MGCFGKLVYSMICKRKEWWKYIFYAAGKYVGKVSWEETNLVMRETWGQMFPILLKSVSSLGSWLKIIFNIFSPLHPNCQIVHLIGEQDLIKCYMHQRDQKYYLLLLPQVKTILILFC